MTRNSFLCVSKIRSSPSFCMQRGKESGATNKKKKKERKRREREEEKREEREREENSKLTFVPWIERENERVLWCIVMLCVTVSVFSCVSLTVYQSNDLWRRRFPLRASFDSDMRKRDLLYPFFEMRSDWGYKFLEILSSFLTLDRLVSKFMLCL